MVVALDNKEQLRQATMALQLRGLKHASQWSAELLAGLYEGDNDGPQVVLSPQSAKLLVDVEKSDRYLLAKTYFDLGEFQRAAHALNPQKKELDSLELFLRSYSLFMAGEKSKEQETLELNDPLERSKAAGNPNLETLRTELLGHYKRGELDAFGLYILGMVLKEFNMLEGNDGAYYILCESVKQFPWNWGAWLDLADICSKNAKLFVPSALLLETSQQNIGPSNPAPWARSFFLVHIWVTMGGVPECTEALTLLDQLRLTFPHSSHLLSQSARATYELRKYVPAMEIFEELREVDPYRIENMDTYSNIMYIRESHAALSHLAHVCIKIDKYSPETSCIIGNYYSLKGNHGAAVIYFQRALKVDANYQAAWTLMGHEFIELKNTASAIESYRRGVDCNPRDYRAWYGLGQAYEMLSMFFYALYYFRKAVLLRPQDGRMWSALGNCFSRIDRRDEAIKAFERCSCCGEEDSLVALDLARLYAQGESSSDQRRAAENYRTHLDASDKGHRTVLHTGVAEALKFLSRFAKGEGALAVAAKYCSRLLECGGAEEEWAKQQLRDIRALEKESR